MPSGYCIRPLGPQGALVPLVALGTLGNLVVLLTQKYPVSFGALDALGALLALGPLTRTPWGVEGLRGT